MRNPLWQVTSTAGPHIVMLLSTLRSFVACLGGDLEINAVFNDVRVTIAS